jgi:hypothetical protein
LNEFLARINAVRVTAEDLIHARDALKRFALDAHGLEAASIAIAERFGSDPEPMKAAAVIFRLEALQRLLGAGLAAGPDEARDGEPPRALFEAAARCRIVAHEGESRFDPAEFGRIAAQAAGVAGNA